MTKTNEPNGLTNWLRQNAWAIILVTAGIVATNAIQGVRISAMEVKLAEYPSQDFFDLKFKTVDDKFMALEKQISELKAEVRALK